jgi:RNA polymerase sigma-70 factor, ECF subfamily
VVALSPQTMVVVEVADGRIAGWTSFLDAARLFPLFGLPLAPTP